MAVLQLLETSSSIFQVNYLHWQIHMREILYTLYIFAQVKSQVQCSEPIERAY